MPIAAVNSTLTVNTEPTSTTTSGQLRAMTPMTPFTVRCSGRSKRVLERVLKRIAREIRTADVSYANGVISCEIPPCRHAQVVRIIKSEEARQQARLKRRRQRENRNRRKRTNASKKSPML